MSAYCQRCKLIIGDHPLGSCRCDVPQPPDCIHGSLKRSCEVCTVEAERDDVAREVARTSEKLEQAEERVRENAEVAGELAKKLDAARGERDELRHLAREAINAGGLLALYTHGRSENRDVAEAKECLARARAAVPPPWVRSNRGEI